MWKITETITGVSEGIVMLKALYTSDETDHGDNVLGKVGKNE